MNVALRQKELKDGRLSLFLDYYLPKAKQTRKKESLKLYLHPNPKTRLQKEHNKKTKSLAESIRAKSLLELQHEVHNFSHLIQPTETDANRSFIAYFREHIEKRKNANSSYSSWKATLNFLIHFIGDTVVEIGDVDTTFCEEFRAYLLQPQTFNQGVKLSINSAHLYFTKFKTAMSQAYKDKIIKENPCQGVSNIGKVETQREFLTLEELKQAYTTDCKNPLLKQAFIFSCLTGLRKSDILKLKWREIQYSQAQGWYIRFTQKKTKGVETLPISKQAMELLGTKGDPDEQVFKGLRFHGSTTLYIQKWMTKSGIYKDISFHCARHTYATLQLSLGTDIYTVSNMLGHKHLKTTEIYAKIIDKKKVTAANAIPDLCS